MSPIRILLSAILLIALNPALAGGPVADLGIEAAVQPAGITPPGTEGTVIITITNHGPDTGSAAFEMIRTNDGAGFSFPPLEFSGLKTGPCNFLPPGQPPPGETVGIFGSWSTLGMMPGEPRTCTFGFRILETSKMSQIMRWEVSATGVADDPNPTNNQAEVLLRFAGNSDPLSVPILPPWALLILVLLFGWIALGRVTDYLA